jgi:hypothetical protein
VRPESHPFVLTALGLIAGATVALVTSQVRSAPAAAVPTIDVSKVHKGMKGYGLTVFEGTTPEKFEVEVIDVLHNFRPSMDIMLVKTIHPRLNKVNAVGGCSGSPIFLDEGGTAKLAGAYAYGWPYGNEPIAGVTPIHDMLAELTRPLSPLLLPKAGAAPIGPQPGAAKKTADLGGSTTFRGEAGEYTLAKHVEQVASRWKPSGNGATGSAQMLDIPLAVGGMSDRAIRELTSTLSPLGLVPLQAGGGGGATPSKDAPLHYVDGGGISIQLMRGDSAAQGQGTVTHVIGNKVLAFGHPMMEMGATNIPSAIGRVLWILSSNQRSFKIMEPVRSLGTMVQDRGTTIIVDENQPQQWLPISVDIQGDATAPKKKWNIEIVHDRFFTPLWSAFAFGDAVETTLSDKRDASWTLETTIAVKGHGTLKFEDFGVSPSGVPGGGAFWMSRAGYAVGELLNNPWEDVTIERIDSKLMVDWKRDIVRLRSAELLDPVVEAGQTARVKLTLKPYQGAERTTIVAVPIDKTYAGRDVDLEIVPGWSIVPDAAAPENLSQMLHNIALPTGNPKTYVVQYRHLETGLAYNGNVAARLPGFAVDALRPTSTTTGPEAFQPMIRKTVDVGSYAEGSTRLRVTVKAPTK